MTQKIFNRKLLKIYRDKASETINQYSMILDNVAEMLIQRIEYLVEKKSCNNILAVGCRNKKFYQKLNQLLPNANKLATDISEKMLQATIVKGFDTIIIDDENLINNSQITNKKYDLVVSLLHQHWINDVTGNLSNIYHILNEKGYYISSIFGGDSLHQLRNIVDQVQIKYNKFTTYIPPFIEVKTAGQLLQKTKFFNPVSDSQKFTIEYHNLTQLLYEIKYIGENNILFTRHNGLMSRQEYQEICLEYDNKFVNSSGNIETMIEIISMSGQKKS